MKKRTYDGPDACRAYCRSRQTEAELEEHPVSSWTLLFGVEIIRQKKLCAEGKLEAYLGPAPSQPLGLDGR